MSCSLFGRIYLFHDFFRLRPAIGAILRQPVRTYTAYCSFTLDISRPPNAGLDNHPCRVPRGCIRNKPAGRTPDGLFRTPGRVAREQSRRSSDRAWSTAAPVGRQHLLYMCRLLEHHRPRVAIPETPSGRNQLNVPVRPGS